MTKKKPTLLCPAGTPEALDAAIAAGADAVYFGADAFNARMFAGNFTAQTLEEAIRKCAFYGVESNVTVNTLVHGKEEADLLRLCERLYRLGADALILAEPGIAAAIHRAFPDFALHASTQCGGHGLRAAKEFAKLGFSRMVAAREMKKEDLKRLCALSPIETEIFIHGALCVSASGGCLFSAMVGGRSGNRGECAQPCRLPCTVEGGKDRYALSLRDNCLAGHIKELCEMGADALKIEGRMKSPAYVAGVTRIYRRLIDEERNATAEEITALAELFSRGGFTDAYYRGTPYVPMGGVRREEDKEKTAAAEKRALAETEKRRIPCDVSATVQKGKPTVLSMTARDVTVTVSGQIPDEAITSPLTEQSVEKQLTKLGATPFSVRSFRAEVEPGCALPPAALNALRREGAEALEKKISKDPARKTEKTASLCRFGDTERTGVKTYALFRTASQIPDNAAEYCDLLFLPVTEFARDPDAALLRGVNAVELPPVLFDGEEEAVRAMLCEAYARGIRNAAFSGLSQLSLCQEVGMAAHGSLRCNVFCDGTLSVYAQAGACDMTVSPELSDRQLAALSHPIPRGAIIYGRLPLMTLERCILRRDGGKLCGDCRACEKDPTVRHLVDRRGAAFPVLREYPHRNVIYNSVPVWMFDRVDGLQKDGADLQVLLFTDENKARCAAVLDAFGRQTAADVPARRMGRRENKNPKSKEIGEKHR